MARNVSGRNVRVTDRDHGYKERLKAISKIGRHVVNVGIQGDRAAAKHQGAAQKKSGFAALVTTAKSLSVGEVAAIHEFGLGVPERSWLRAWVDGDKASIYATLRALANRM